ncbi:response regulator [Nitrosopumilus sp.]|uniref:response regulator transcription factor n=1 Tax=Nitrosopumilus sp. TaxID=2024843 RepID=UPI00247D5EE6|nr:response regulator [Nitrosopumilus sp.]MCV0430654.1 response regulator [Nitrosopumilus sp.]
MVSCIVVDDDLDIVDLFCELLEISNVQVLAKGHDGKQAVELYEKFKPDVIFVDLSMPKFNGQYAITKIRRIHPDAKIILLTGDSGSESDLRETLDVDHVLHKPFNMRSIREFITVALLDSAVSKNK